MGINTERYFNLVEEEWIPVAGTGLVSLDRIFSDSDLSALGGTPVEKVALTKLFLAIAQAAYTPENENDWAALGASGLAEKTRQYLGEKRDLFWLYGGRPFLQMPVPKIAQAEKKPIGAFLPNTPTRNTSILTQSQVKEEYNDAEKALSLVSLAGFARGGKQPDKKILLSEGYGPKSSAKPGPSLGFLGYLHSFLFGASLQETIWLNLLTLDHINDMQIYPGGIGVPPWEQMPEGEDCSVAKALKESLMGRLVPLCRFGLLNGDCLHCTEGIVHPVHKDGGVDPTITVNFTENPPKALWVNPEKRPWRELTSLLSFFNTGGSRSYDCAQLRIGVLRAREKVMYFSIWSGGIRVSSKSGEQGATGSDDYVESEILLFSDWLKTSTWFIQLQHEMDTLGAINKAVYGATNGYFKQLKVKGEKHAAMASSLFWQLCERKFQDLINACTDQTGEYTAAMRHVFVGYANRAFNTFCPWQTSRQMEAWAANRPNLGRFINNLEK